MLIYLLAGVLFAAFGIERMDQVSRNAATIDDETEMIAIATLKEQIVELASKRPGLTDREITDQLRGRSEAQQPVNQACRQLAAAGVLMRRNRDDGMIGNCPTGTAMADDGPRAAMSKSDHDNVLSEDEVKAALQRWLEVNGWTPRVSWGHTRGIDIDAWRGSDRWIIEIKGPGSRQPMRVNYFIGILGETLQRMEDPMARYSIAFPDLQQYRRLWDRLPGLAKERTGNIAAAYRRAWQGDRAYMKVQSGGNDDSV